MGYYGDYNITGKGEFLLCPVGKYCPIGTAGSKVLQSECQTNFYCPFGTAAQLLSDGRFDESTLRQLNKWVLIEEVRSYVRQSEAAMKDFEKKYEMADIYEMLTEWEKKNDTTSIQRYNWER